ncbi:hypothetical protein CJI56_00665 [Gardnerella vaginalis]|nr:hypothetical protein CYJ58_01065 [Gardnerella vaginalis]PKZ46030.1 hypothetical protein CYJ68_03185 [Gardnerella vaginalis]PKZ46874.1 hypothetical protein CYJ67_03405 [Gardnerella vaginalis]PKZ57235.1 hypothetical protein CYJ63_04520 [Gardnerella vaginalis]PKZ58464.1 hypothetical protein CYJ62_03685 [Gardnerella vaginalis]
MICDFIICDFILTFICNLTCDLTCDFTKMGEVINPRPQIKFIS